MKKFKRATGLAVVFFVIPVICGCKAEEAKPAGFIKNDTIMTKDENLPFHRAWYDKDFYWSGCNKVVVAEVNTDYLAKAGWWESLSMAWDREKDTRYIAEYMRTAVQQAFEKKEDNRFSVASSAGPETLVLEMALVELAPTKAFLNAAGLLVGVTIDHGMVAIEARIRDGRSGRVVATFADREQGQTSVVNVADYSWFGHAENVIDIWADQIVVTLNSNFSRYVEDSETLTLDPW